MTGFVPGAYPRKGCRSAAGGSTVRNVRIHHGLICGESRQVLFGSSRNPPESADVENATSGPEQRSNKGPGSDPKFQIEEEIPGRENFDQQGRHGNIKQNTTNQGYQQDR
jgi:hypothetical protein